MSLFNFFLEIPGLGDKEPDPVGTIKKMHTIFFRDVETERGKDATVEVAKKYMSHELEVFSNIAKARSGYMEATTPEQKIEATKQFDKAMSTFKVQVEAYPELKADKTMGSLMTELTNTEDKIAYQREYYNRVVGTYNVKIEIFPSNIIAGMFNFTRKEFLKVESEEERKAVKVEF